MSNTVSPAQVDYAVNQTIQANGLLILTFHVIGGNQVGDVYYSTANFIAIVNYIQSKQKAGLLQTTNLSTYYDQISNNS